MNIVDLEKLVAGDPLTVSRAITAAENDPAGADGFLKQLRERTGKAHRVGITGPPGAGKSTLISGLVPLYRKRGSTVGVLAFDPTSQKTGGAVLGDRVRMKETDDAGVFYRSMATRGGAGGLSRACRDATRILEGAGKERVLIETVGIGQGEIDVAGVADTVVLVLVPESGDFMQAIKAGILEFGDILVVNKSDRPGADEVAADLEEMARHRKSEEGWIPPVLTACAREGEGIGSLLEEIERHREFLKEEGRLEKRRTRQVREELEQRFGGLLQQELRSRFIPAGLDRTADEVMQGGMTPHEGARGVLEQFLLEIRGA